MTASDYRAAFRAAYKLFPRWAQDLYGPQIADQLTELEGCEAFGLDASTVCAWLESRLSAWRGGSLRRVPPVLPRMVGESSGAWLDRMYAAASGEPLLLDKKAPAMQCWPGLA